MAENGLRVEPTEKEHIDKDIQPKKLSMDDVKLADDDIKLSDDNDGTNGVSETTTSNGQNDSDDGEKVVTTELTVNCEDGDDFSNVSLGSRGEKANDFATITSEINCKMISLNVDSAPVDDDTSNNGAAVIAVSPSQDEQVRHI